MIGSHTMIIKSGSTYDLHVFGGGVGMSMLAENCKKQGTSMFSKMYDSVKKWKKPEQSNLTEEETIQVADATGLLWSGNQQHKNNPTYSKFAGDGVYMLDLDGSAFYYRDRDKKMWVQL